MPLYEVTPLAPSKIADKPHNGPGTVITLTESQAKLEEILGHVKPFVAPAARIEKKKI